MKLLAAPFRLMLGLPAFYGITVGNRVLQIGRWIGLYKGPIHFVVHGVKPVRIGLTGGSING